MLQPKYTMNGLQVEDQMAANGNVHTRVLRVLLREQLDSLRPRLRRVISNELNDQVQKSAITTDAWKHVPTFSMAKRLLTVVNSSVFFGEELSRKPDFVLAAEQYLDDLFLGAEVLRLMPSFVAPLLAPLLMRRYKATKTLVRYMTPVVEERIRRSEAGDLEAKDTDLIQFFVDTSAKKAKWPARKIVQVILGIWFASVHQPALCLGYALDDICEHPEYVPLLREEIQKYSNLTTGDNLTASPLLDSFLRESARLHPSDSISVRRQAIKAYTFSDGTHIAAGDVACVPLQAIMRDSTYYQDSLTFNGFRFVNEDGTRNTALLTDTAPTYPLWGLGRRAW